MRGESVVPEDAPCIVYSEAPIDHAMLVLCAAPPCGYHRDEIDETGDTAPAEALGRDHAGFELGRVEPTRVLGREVHVEALPELASSELAEHGHHRGARVDVEIVHDEMNLPGAAIASRDLLQRPDEGPRLAIGGCEGQPSSGQRLDDAVDVGRAAAHVIVIGARQSPWSYRLTGPCILVQHDRALVETTTGS